MPMSPNEVLTFGVIVPFQEPSRTVTTPSVPRAPFQNWLMVCPLGWPTKAIQSALRCLGDERTPGPKPPSGSLVDPRMSLANRGHHRSRPRPPPHRNNRTT